MSLVTISELSVSWEPLASQHNKVYKVLLLGSTEALSELKKSIEIRKQENGKGRKKAGKTADGRRAKRGAPLFC